jgi:hypothetical protein
VSRSPKLVTLKAWARAVYGTEAPTIVTLRRWCRDGNILPFPKKHGRSYYVREDARYVRLDDPDYVRLLRLSRE